MISGKMAQ